MVKAQKVEHLLERVRGCNLCQDLPLGPKPILQLSASAKILIVGQAPGRITHHKGIPFDAPSGNRLRDWMGISRDLFYDAEKIAIVPMGLCYPGTGSGGDLPPRQECAPAWRNQILRTLKSVELTLIIGRYAIDWHAPEHAKSSVTQAAKSWPDLWPNQIILPHPSPRNIRWLRSNPWFEDDVVPMFQSRIAQLLG